MSSKSIQFKFVFFFCINCLRFSVWPFSFVFNANISTLPLLYFIKSCLFFCFFSVYQGRTGAGRADRGRGMIPGELTRGGFRRHDRGDEPEKVIAPPSELVTPIMKQPMSVGLEGIPIKLITNFVPLKTSFEKVYHYDLNVSFVPNARDRAPPRPDAEPNVNEERFLQRHAKTILDKFYEENKDVFLGQQAFIFDGFKNLFSTQLLRMNRSIVKLTTVVIDNKPKEFRVKLELVDTVDMGVVKRFLNHQEDELPTKVLTIIDVLFKHVSQKYFQPFQRKLYDCEYTPVSSKNGLVDFVKGFGVSTRITEVGLAVNTHLATSCVVSKKFRTLNQLVSKLIGCRPDEVHFDAKFSRKINNLVKHLKVYTEHTGTKHYHTIERVVSETPRTKMFTSVDHLTKKERTLSVHTYFKEQYKIDVLEMPLVKMTGKFGRMIPMELCLLMPNQFLANHKTDASIQAELLRQSTVNPEVYFSRASTNMTKINYMEQDGFNLKFGVDISKNFVQLEGRVLKAPELNPPGPRDKFHQVAGAGKPIDLVAFCLDPMRPDHEFRAFNRKLIAAAESFGMRINLITQRSLQLATARDLENLFSNIKANVPNVDFVLTVIPERGEYSTIRICLSSNSSFVSRLPFWA